MALGNINVPDNNKLGKLETAASASKLSNTENIGSATRPIYFNSSGVPVAGTYELHKTVPEDALFTDTTYTNATTEKDGLMSASDKTKLEGIEEGANKTTVDSSLSSTSTNPVQNKVINSALNSRLLSNGWNTIFGETKSVVNCTAMFLLYDATNWWNNNNTGSMQIDLTFNYCRGYWYGWNDNGSFNAYVAFGYKNDTTDRIELLSSSASNRFCFVSKKNEDGTKTVYLALMFSAPNNAVIYSAMYNIKSTGNISFDNLVKFDNSIYTIERDTENHYFDGIAELWKSYKTYNVGDYVLCDVPHAFARKRINLWKCKVSNSGQYPSDSGTYWDKVSISSEIKSLEDRIAALENK